MSLKEKVAIATGGNPEIRKALTLAVAVFVDVVVGR